MEERTLKQILRKFDYPQQKILEINEYGFEDMPNEIAFLLRREKDSLALFEVDTVISLEYIIDSINKIGKFVSFYPTKRQLTFETSNPVRVATLYKKPSGWAEIQKYATDQKGSPNFYFLALVE